MIMITIHYIRKAGHIKNFGLDGTFKTMCGITDKDCNYDANEDEFTHEAKEIALTENKEEVTCQSCINEIQYYEQRKQA